MGQSLDCWENEFLLPDCFPQKYLLAAEIIVLTLLTITHFEMYLERGLGSLLAAFPYKVQAPVCNPTRHVKALLLGHHVSDLMQHKARRVCLVQRCQPLWAEFSPYSSARREELLSAALHYLHRKPLCCFCEHCKSKETEKQGGAGGNRSHGILGMHVPIVPVQIASRFLFLLCLLHWWQRLCTGVNQHMASLVVSCYTGIP